MVNLNYMDEAAFALKDETQSFEQTFLDISFLVLLELAMDEKAESGGCDSL